MTAELTVTAEDRLQRARSALTMIHQMPFNAEAPPEALTGDLTPTAQHYVRSNFALPDHDGSLEIGGAVDRPTTLTLDDLRAMPSVDRAVTLECAGNGRLETRPLPAGEPWGAYAVSTAMWTGARLSDVLALARPRQTGVEVRFEGADSGSYLLHPVLAQTVQGDLTFVRSLLLEHATDPAAEILIAYEMNGEPLGADHGAPFRLIVPHWFAVASVKWLKRIDVLEQPFEGEFQTGHYVYEWPDRPHERVTTMRVRARITDPAPGATLAPGTYVIRGKAWSGTGPVTNVDLSFTGEGTWNAAVVESPKGPHQWQDWAYEWEVALPGRYSVRARATDAAGNVQPEVPPWNRLGYGNNAIEVSHVDVR
jgi:DMSO/TMAO reductase YedYZ molybdopterin-dependent catalytic subunit